MAGQDVTKTVLICGIQLLAVTGCMSGKPPASPEDTVLSKVKPVRYSTAGRAALEPGALALNRAIATRDGERLTLHLASGASKTLLDTNECGPDNLVYERCVHYHFLGHLQKQQFFLLSESFYEGANFVLIDEVTGELQRFGDLPRFSPTGNHVLILNDDDEGDGDDGIEIWRRHGHHLMREYAGSPAESSTGGYTHYYLEQWPDEAHIDLRAETFVGGRQVPDITRVRLSLAFTGWKAEVRH
jgi:hypothetical protein